MAIWHSLCVPEAFDLATWLREQCAGYVFDVAGIFNRPGADRWPLQATSLADLETQLIDREHLLPLPQEPAALANVLEVLVVDFLLEAAAQVQGLQWQRGSERGYPDIEMLGPALADRCWAVDIKVARRAILKRGNPTRTNSRITLYTGNTYFKHPDLPWPGTFRPFTTREYIGAVMEIDRLREGRGDFDTSDEFYRYWQAYPFRLSPGIQRTLARLVKQQRDELKRLRRSQPPAEGA